MADVARGRPMSTGRTEIERALKRRILACERQLNTRGGSKARGGVDDRRVGREKVQKDGGRKMRLETGQQKAHAEKMENGNSDSKAVFMTSMSEETS